MKVQWENEELLNPKDSKPPFRSPWFRIWGNTLHPGKSLSEKEGALVRIDSWDPMTVAYQALPSMGIFQADILEWVAIFFKSLNALSASSASSCSTPNRNWYEITASKQPHLWCSWFFAQGCSPFEGVCLLLLPRLPVQGPDSSPKKAASPLLSGPLAGPGKSVKGAWWGVLNYL